MGKNCTHKIFLFTAFIVCLGSLLTQEVSNAETGEPTAANTPVAPNCTTAAQLATEALKLPAERAIEEFGRAAELCPQMDEARYNQAVYLSKAGRNAEALTAIERINGERLEAQLLKARVLMQMGRAQEAEPLCQRLLTSNPHSPEAALLLSAIYAQQGRLNDALRVLQALPQPEISNSYVRFNLALLYEKVGNLDESNTAMLLLSQEKDLPDDMRYEVAQYYVRTKNFTPAASVLRATISVPGKLLLAKVLLSLKEYDDAERALRSVPNSPTQQELLAVLLIIRHQEEQALATLQNLEKQSGTLSAKLLALKSFAYLSLGLTEKARETAAASLGSDATVALAHYVLGESLSRLGSKTAGQESKQRAIAIDKRFTEPTPNWWESWLSW